MTAGAVPTTAEARRPTQGATRAEMSPCGVGIEKGLGLAYPSRWKPPSRQRINGRHSILLPSKAMNRSGRPTTTRHCLHPWRLRPTLRRPLLFHLTL